MSEQTSAAVDSVQPRKNFLKQCLREMNMEPPRVVVISVPNKGQLLFVGGKLKGGTGKQGEWNAGELERAAQAAAEAVGVEVQRASLPDEVEGVEGRDLEVALLAFGVISTGQETLFHAMQDASACLVDGDPAQIYVSPGSDGFWDEYAFNELAADKTCIDLQRVDPDGLERSELCVSVAEAVRAVRNEQGEFVLEDGVRLGPLYASAKDAAPRAYEALEEVADQLGGFRIEAIQELGLECALAEVEAALGHL